ncbi:MAG: RNA polymerase sigma factor [Planctomycetes bacterium]|nr:RNA polymerase sigma factor [Planctomycetota bacterium]
MLVPDDFEQHTSWVLAWFRRRFGTERAEDLAQEAFVAALRAGPRLSRDGLGRYLLGIVRRLSLVEMRRRRLVQTPVDDLVGPADNGPGDERVAAAVRALPPQLEQVVTLHYGQDRSYEETATLLGVPRATVQSRLRRALERLRRVLVEEENVS